MLQLLRFADVASRTYAPARFAEAAQVRKRAALPYELTATTYKAAAWALAKKRKRVRAGDREARLASLALYGRREGTGTNVVRPRAGDRGCQAALSGRRESTSRMMFSIGTNAIQGTLAM